MEKQRNRKKILALGVISFFVTTFGASAEDPLSDTFSQQSSSGSGSNNSIISVDQNLEYYNAGDNTSIIGNYFVGYYHDSVLGYFQTDWSGSKNQNVRIIGSTSKCSEGFGYKLGGYAYSEYFGYVDFDYDATTFVYYCEENEELHGYAYSADLGYQNFEGITFDIDVEVTTVAETPDENEDFVNDGSTINNTTQLPQADPEGETVNSNFTPNTIQNSTIDFEVSEESLFYIIK